jgi:5-methylcytosine-specific restriction endonuclease McrA
METVINTCKRCGKKFAISKYLNSIGKGVYCSYECYLVPRETRRCPHCSKEFTVRATDVKRFCSPECKYASKERSDSMKAIKQLPRYIANYLASMKTRNASDKWSKHWLTKRGAGNHNYKGGTYGNERHTDMGRSEYINWRNAVFQRDNYTCQDCNKKGGDLHAHHIKEWAKFPALRHTVSNGVTLCVPCHRKRHKK